MWLTTDMCYDTKLRLYDCLFLYQIKPKLERFSSGNFAVANADSTHS